MMRVARLEVPLAKSFCSRSKTRLPPMAHSRAIATPFTPPPMTIASYGCDGSGGRDTPGRTLIKWTVSESAVLPKMSDAKCLRADEAERRMLRRKAGEDFCQFLVAHVIHQ